MSKRNTQSPSSPGDSAVQRRAEGLLIEQASRELGVRLVKKRVNLPDGGWLEIDGLSESPPVLCEAWAHIGPAKSAQKNKLLADALKLLYAAQFHPQSRKVLVLADDDAARHLRGTAWMGAALNAFKVEVHVVNLPADFREAILAAQHRQFR